MKKPPTSEDEGKDEGGKTKAAEEEGDECKDVVFQF